MSEFALLSLRHVYTRTLCNTLRGVPPVVTGSTQHGEGVVCRRICVLLGRAGGAHEGGSGAVPGGGPGLPLHPPRDCHHAAQPGGVHGAQREEASTGHQASRAAVCTVSFVLGIGAELCHAGRWVL